MHWWKVEVEFCASTMIGTKHVILKPSPRLGRLRVVGLASHVCLMKEVMQLTTNFLKKLTMCKLATW